MTSTTHETSKDPDLFSAEVHHCLLTQGLRSRRLRGLMRAARRNAELERIFETKVTEFRRYLREIRTPTIWNLPLRAGEWLADNARFTPPREVMTTMAYVAFVLVGVEVVKSWRPWDYGSRMSSDSRRIVARRATFETDVDSYSAPRDSANSLSNVDNWLAKELQHAAQSSEMQQVLKDRFQAAIASVSADLQLTHKQLLREWIETDEFRELVTAALQNPIPSAISCENTTSATSSALEAATKQAVQELLATEDFKRLLGDAVRNSAVVPAKPAQAVAGPVANTRGAP